MDNSKIITNLKSIIGDRKDFETKDSKLIDTILKTVINENGDNLAVDFIDCSNLDCISKFTFNMSNREFELVWHDFRSLDRSDEINQMFIQSFGSEIQKSILVIDSLKVKIIGDIPVLLLKSIYLDEKEINRRWNSKCSLMKQYEYSMFSKLIFRKVKNYSETILVPIFNIYSIAISPKIITSPEKNSKLLFDVNKNIPLEAMKAKMSELTTYSGEDQEYLKDIGNNFRRRFELAIKLAALRENYSFPGKNGSEKEIQKLMLGDLIPFVKERPILDLLKTNLDNTVDTLNECSHDSGKPISRKSLLIAVIYAYATSFDLLR